jgi:8-oxo-dGTP diphosphatase
MGGLCRSWRGGDPLSLSPGVPAVDLPKSADRIGKAVNSVAGIAREGNRYFIARRISGGVMGEKWEFPGGKTEEGESDAEALVREYAEEFAVPVRVGKFLGTASFVHEGRQRILNAYSINFLKTNFRLNEHTEWRWATLEEMERLDFVDSDRKLFGVLKMNTHPEI